MTAFLRFMFRKRAIFLGFVFRPHLLHVWHSFTESYCRHLVRGGGSTAILQ